MEYRNVFTMADALARERNAEHNRITIRFGDIPMLYLSAMSGFSKEKFNAIIFYEKRSQKRAEKKWEESYINRTINGWFAYHDYYGENNRKQYCKIFFYIGYWAKQRGNSEEKLLQTLDSQFKNLGIHKPEWQDFTGKFYMPTTTWGRSHFSHHDRSFILSMT